MFAIQWKMVNFITIVTYVLMIIILPFNQTTSSILLFALIAFWSRLPGTGTPPPGEWLILLDVVDVFSMIVAINIGGLSGAIFSLVTNMGSRVVGSFPDWITVLKDVISQFVVCLIIPFIHVIFGSNILVTTVWYSVLRLLMAFPLRLLYAKYPLPQAIVSIIGGGILLMLINGFYAGLFGNFFDNLLKDGVKFNWVLFLFATLVIFGTKFYFTKFKKPKFVGG
jgi:hypothetical protein